MSSVGDTARDVGSRREALRCAIVTVSDTRTLETDETGSEVFRLLEAAGHRIVERTVVPEDPARVALVIRHWISAEIDVLLVNGGRGTWTRDGTIEVIRRFLDREIPGFAQIFTMLAHKQVGSPAMLLEAVAGLAHGKLIFALPEAKWAVDLCMEKLIVPELQRVIAELRT